MVVLGIGDSQDAGAALFIDGILVAAVNEERLNRVKLWGGFPAASVREVLRLGGVVAEDVDTVVVGTRITPNVLARAARDFHQGLRRSNGQFGYVLNLFITYQVIAQKSGFIEAAEGWVAHTLLGRELRQLGIDAKLILTEHHDAHAAAAWVTSPFDRALVVTMDGLGDGLAVTVSVGERGRGLKRVFAQSGYSGLTLYYSRLTEYLGFTPIRDEGKVNALAAYTDSLPAIGVARQLLHCRNGRFNLHNHLLPQSKDGAPYSALRGYSREEVAASFQKNLEDSVGDFLRYWLARTGTDKVAFAGGLFANVKLNQRIAAMDAVSDVYVFPHMGDGGLAVGGVLVYLKQDPQVLPNLYLGPGLAASELEQAIAQSGLPFRRSEDVALETAQLLADGWTVARCAGRMEYGPRALGNRSILVSPSDPTLMGSLNAKLQRNAFMPFAPAILESEYDSCFVGGGKGRHAAQFMTVSFDTTSRFRQLCPATVHVDGTARPQMVREGTNPGFARVLREYLRLTGLPALVNTSFNMHEQPIVNTPTDALRAFQSAGLDYLALDDFIVARPGCSLDLRDPEARTPMGRVQPLAAMG